MDCRQMHDDSGERTNTGRMGRLISVGGWVRVCGLLSSTQHNNSVGVVQSVDQTKPRYNVQVVLAATQCDETVLALREGNLAALDDLESAAAQFRVGRALFEQDRCLEAMEYYEMALETRMERFSSEPNEEVATTLEAIATVHLKQGTMKQSLVLYEKAMAIKEELYGWEHPITQRLARVLEIVLNLMDGVGPSENDLQWICDGCG